MTDLSILTGCELHVHTIGCLYPENILALGKDVYQGMDWTEFVTVYEAAFGIKLNPISLFHDGLHGGDAGLARFRRQVVYGEEDGGDFGRFQAKINLSAGLSAYYRQALSKESLIMKQVVDAHRNEGIDYVEYRMLYRTADDPDGAIDFHKHFIHALQQAEGNGITTGYLLGIPRDAPMAGYDIVQRLFDEHPETIRTVVGLDFCAVEEGFPPSSVQAVFDRLKTDNQQNPERALEVGYHVGESYFDKSLESAIRWCHEIAEMGAKRLGHAIALGLDPAIAIQRRPEAHTMELVSERLAQIDYDLQYKDGLEKYDVAIDETSLKAEKAELLQKSLTEKVQRTYTLDRLDTVRKRQDFVLDRLSELGTVIETCPTSNLRIGGVPSPEHHPIHRFLKSKVNLVISADDPGVFDSPLAAEVDWVLDHTGYSAEQLIERLGDPRRFWFRRD
ncbi:MAG: adenosine deaminase [Chloroflexota bacterium]